METETEKKYAPHLYNTIMDRMYYFNHIAVQSLTDFNNQHSMKHERVPSYASILASQGKIPCDFSD